MTKKLTKKRLIILITAAAAIVLLAAAAPVLKVGFFYKVEPVLDKNEISEIFSQAAADDRRILLSADGEGFIYDNNLYCEDSVRPFFDEEGFAYYPLNLLADVYGAEIKRSSKYPLIRIADRNGADSYLVLNTNLAVVGAEVVFAERKIVERDGIYYADPELAAKTLGIICVADYKYGIVKFNSTSVSSGDAAAAETLWRAEPYTDSIEEIASAAAALDMEYDDAFVYAREGKLYYSDAEGRTAAYIVNDKNELIENEPGAWFSLAPDTFYIKGYGGDDEGLYTYTEGGMLRVSDSPEIAQENLVNEMKAAYWRCKYDTDVLGLDLGERETALREAIEDISKYDAALLSGIPEPEAADSRSGWSALYAEAEPGDVILCNRADNTLYGYNNHSAVVIEKLSGETLRLVHARSAEYGVGSGDEELDYLNYETLMSNEYWRKTDRITLYKYNGMTDAQREEIAGRGENEFNGYDFGYYNILGAKEVTCAELIKLLYGDAGIEIGPSKEEAPSALFANDVEGAVYLPDNIMLSDDFITRAFWKR